VKQGGTDMNDGGSAFPTHGVDAPISYGMTLRDWFAGQALIALANDAERGLDLAREAYRLADDMLNARKERS
jgi:hypothetical protein